jgi:hypothetical protein
MTEMEGPQGNTVKPMLTIKHISVSHIGPEGIYCYRKVSAIHLPIDQVAKRPFTLGRSHEANSIPWNEKWRKKWYAVEMIPVGMGDKYSAIEFSGLLFHEMTGVFAKTGSRIKNEMPVTTDIESQTRSIAAIFE